MAGNEAVIGDLVVRLIGDASQLKKELTKAGVTAQNFQRQTDRSMKGVRNATKTAASSFSNLVRSMLPAISVGLAVAGTIRAITNAISNTNQLDELSAVIGVSVERLSELQNIADAVGISFQSLSQAMRQFSARMAESVASPTSRGAQALRALGISARDAEGNLKSFDQVLLEVADSFPRYADGTNKAAIAAAIFGEEAGPRLVRLLNQGRAGLEELRQQLGHTVTTEDAERVRVYNRAMAAFNNEWGNFTQELMRLAIPAIQEALRNLTELLKVINRIPAAVERSNDSLHARERLLTAETEHLRSLENQLSVLLQRYESGERDNQSLTAAMALLNAMIEEQRRKVEGLSGALNIQATALRAVLAVANSVEFPPGRQAPGLDPHATERAVFEVQKIMERMTGTRSILDEMNFAWATHADRVRMAVEKINSAHAAGFKRDQALHQARRQLMLREQEQMLSTASLAAQTIQALWPKQKGAAIAAAVINTAVGITRALSSLDPPWSWTQAALIAAAGAAQIATIRSTNVESGGGAAPSVGGAEAAGEQAAPSRSLHVSGVDPAHLFTGSSVRGLIDMINEEVRNGVTLISTRNAPI